MYLFHLEISNVIGTQVKQQKRHVGCNTSTPFIPLEKGPLATSTPLKRPRREAEDSDCSFQPGMTDSSIYNERYS